MLGDVLRSQSPVSPQGPWRTCVGCGQQQARSELIRIVRTFDGSAHVDPNGTAPGRGAWIHPHKECVHNARTRGAILRSYRGRISVTIELWDELAERCTH